MEDATSLGRDVVVEVADALAGSGRTACVAVWPVTAAGSHELTEKEWQRLLRVGLRLSPGADVRELYCFQDIPAFDGLTVRVLRLVQESQPRMRQSEGKFRVWKVQESPVLIRRRTEVGKPITTEKRGSELSSSEPKGGTPAQTGNGASIETISPDKVPRKRHRSDASEGPVAAAKCAVDEVRPPMKTRRLSPEKKERIEAVGPLFPLPDSHGSNASTESSHRPEQSDAARRSHPCQAGFIAVVKDWSSLGSSSQALHSEITPDEEERSTRTSFPRKSDHSERVTIFSVSHRVVAAVEDENEYAAYHQDLVASRSTNVTHSFKSLRSALVSATRQAHTWLRKVCDLSSVLEAITAQHSLDYDLLWIEEDNEQHWTMFGEPSSRGVETKRQQQREQRRITRPKWKFW